MNQNTIDYLPPIRQQNGYTSVITHSKNTIQYQAVEFHVLEMEDVLFHLNSAMMMPDNQIARLSRNSSHSEKSSIQEQQEATRGIEALALAFKELEFDHPLKRVLITAHTDTSGEIQYNFELSLDRGKSVYALLIGNRELWVESVQAEVQPFRHNIEDYQQVLKWVFDKKKWNCDPEQIDDVWGPKTERAIKSFLASAKNEGFFSGDVDNTMDIIRAHPKKLLPSEVLEIIYLLFDEQLKKILGADEREMTERRMLLNQRILIANYPYLPCGEAFPIDSPQKKNYRSRQNRRVEILFFDENEFDNTFIEEVLAKCPLINKKKVITQSNLNKYRKECPLWPFQNHFAPLYIDRKDLYSVVFHLKFVYYNRILKQVTDIAGNEISIKAILDGKPLPTETIWRNGIFYVKVRFPFSLSADPSPPPADFHFEFETDQLWSYTKDASSTPVNIKIAYTEIKKMPFLEQLKYYDLPEKWSSKNYWTRYNGAMNTGDYFEKVISKILNLKPFGNNITSSTKPLIFSLDDTILIDKSKQPLKFSGGDIRLTVFNLSNMEIENPDPDYPYWTTGTIKENYLKEDYLGNLPRAIACNGKFYDITNKRTTIGDVVGARAALELDEDVHTSSGIIKEPRPRRLKTYTSNDKPITKIEEKDLYFLADGVKARRETGFNYSIVNAIKT